MIIKPLKLNIVLPFGNTYQIQKYSYNSFGFVLCIITCFKKKLSIFSASKGRMHFLQSMCLSREVKVQVHIIMLMLKWESRIISWNLVRNKRNFSILNRKSLIQIKKVISFHHVISKWCGYDVFNMVIMSLQYLHVS